MRYKRRISCRFRKHLIFLALWTIVPLLYQRSFENFLWNDIPVDLDGEILRQKIASGIKAIELVVVNNWWHERPWLARTRNDSIIEVRCPDLDIMVRLGRDIAFNSRHSTGDDHTLRANIHHFTDIDKEDLKSSDVVRILHRWEPGYRHKEPNLVRDNFHFLMGFYRHQSRPSGHMMFTPYTVSIDKWFQPSKVHFKDKSEAATLFVHGNCNDISKRKNFVSALMEANLSVHSPGACLHNIDIPELSGTKHAILHTVSERYKFVFVIENALCRDYITEKFGNAMDAGAVPIVRSYRDPVTREQFPAYDKFVPSLGSRYMPNSSYIDLGDFPDAKSAANYILRVANDEALYKSYQWYRYLDNDIVAKVKKQMQIGGFYDQRAMFRDVELVDEDYIQRSLCQTGKQILEMDTSQRIDMMEFNDECVYGPWSWPEGWQASDGWTGWKETFWFIDSFLIYFGFYSG